MSVRGHSEKAVRVGVVGAGWVATDRYLPALGRTRGADVAAVCSQSGADAENAAERFGIARSFERLDVFLREPLDAVVVCMGTGGTISGIGKYLKSQKPGIKIVGVDPVGSIFYDYFRTGRLTTAHSYLVEGFGEDFLPGTMDFDVIDDVVRVTDKESFLWTRRLVREEGIFAGGSSGSAVCGALKWASKQLEPLNILTILPDGAARYLSKIFDDNWMRENGFLEPEYAGAVRDVMAHRPHNVVSVTSSATTIEVVALMKTHEVSQIPILDGDRITGLVTEVDLLKTLVDGGNKGDLPVSAVAGTDFAVLEPRNSAALLGEVLAQDKTVIVQDAGQVVGVLTKIDLIDFISHRMRSNK